MKYIAFSTFLFLALVLLIEAAVPVFGQADRQKQLMIKNMIEHGNALMAKQSFKEAQAEYEKCLQFDPGNVTAQNNIVLLHDNWGVYYFRHNQYQDAQAEWEMALQLNPNDSKANSNMLVLKNTLARMGLDLNTERELVKQGKKAEQEQKDAGQGSAAVILSPHKNGVDAQDKDYVNQYYSHEPGGTSSSTSSTAAKANTEEPKSITPPAAGGTEPLVEQRLARIERKVYGRSLDELPVTKRLEKLETDNFGQISTLPILQRVQKLDQLYP